MSGDQGRAEARRRFGARANTVTPGPTIAEREFGIEDLMRPGGRGRARAAALHGNRNAKQALRDLDNAVRQLAQDDDDSGGDAA